MVETSKASVEIEAGDDGTLVQLVAAGLEVELGSSIGLVAQSDGDLEVALARLAAAAPEPAREDGPRNVTRKAAERAAELGVDVSLIDKAGFVTAEDVEAFAAAAADRDAPAVETDVVLAGLSTENVTLPAIFSVGDDDGALDEAFLESLRADPAAFGALSSDERCDAYRSHGARIGDGVVLGEGTVVVAPRIVLEDGVTIGDRSTIRCEEVFAAGELVLLGDSFRLMCRRAFVGAGTWTAENVEIGGGGHRDPWATFVMGELGFIGGEVFVNVCRPVLIGAEAFVTMRSVLLTHNVGHSCSRASRTVSRASCSRTAHRSESAPSSTPAAASGARRSSSRTRTWSTTSTKGRSPAASRRGRSATRAARPPARASSSSRGGSSTSSRSFSACVGSRPGRSPAGSAGSS